MKVEQNTAEFTPPTSNTSARNNFIEYLLNRVSKILHIQSCKNDHYVTGKDERGKKKKKKEIGIGPRRDL